MGLDLEAKGKATSGGMLGNKGRKLLERCYDHAGDAWGDDLAGLPRLEKNGSDTTLFLPFGSIDTELELTAKSSGEVIAETRWNPVGPGYLMRCVDALVELESACGIDWLAVRSDCGHQGWPNLEVAQTAAVRWIQSLAAEMTQQNVPADASGIAVGMPLDWSYRAPGQVATPVGPRPVEWFKQVRDDANTARKFFSVWDRLDTARGSLGAAKFIMWHDSLWQKARHEGEHCAQAAAIWHLERAYKLDPSLKYPWVSWAELYRHLDASVQTGQADAVEFACRDIVEANAAKSKPDRIGYRRVKLNFASPLGWGIRLPGSTVGVPKDDKVWLFLPSERATIAMTAAELNDSIAPREFVNESFPGADPALSWSGNGVVGRALVKRDVHDGTPIFHGESLVVAASGKFTHLVLDTDDHAMVQEFLKAIKTVTPPGARD